jgi:prevent-host-death family protein
LAEQIECRSASPASSCQLAVTAPPVRRAQNGLLVQDAKARFSEVVDRALHDGPQVVTRLGENAVMIVAYRDFVGAEPAQNFKDFNARPYRSGNQIEPTRGPVRSRGSRPLRATCAWSPDETLIQLNHSGEKREK